MRLKIFYAACVALFMAVACLCMAFYHSGMIADELERSREAMSLLRRQVEAANVAFGKVQELQREVAHARAEREDALDEISALDDDDLRYTYYGRLLREDAGRRAGASEAPDGASRPVPGAAGGGGLP